MARLVETGGTISRRIRLTLRGWGDGTFEARPGKANKETLEEWKRLVMDAYHSSRFEILDALVDGNLTFPEALRLKRQEGLEGLLATARERKRNLDAVADFPGWIEEFLRIQPRAASKQQHEDIAADCRMFLKWLVREHGFSGPEAVTREHWSRENLRAYVAWYRETKHARWLKG
jgi:hypothetical protein